MDLAVRREMEARTAGHRRKVSSVRHIIVASCLNNRTSFQWTVYYAACACNANAPLLYTGVSRALREETVQDDFAQAQTQD